MTDLKGEVESYISELSRSEGVSKPTIEYEETPAPYAVPKENKIVMPIDLLDREFISFVGKDVALDILKYLVTHEFHHLLVSVPLEEIKAYEEYAWEYASAKSGVPRELGNIIKKLVSDYEVYKMLKGMCDAYHSLAQYNRRLLSKAYACRRNQKNLEREIMILVEKYKKMKKRMGT